jgi:hypothetical protein
MGVELQEGSRTLERIRLLEASSLHRRSRRNSVKLKLEEEGLI